jgi:hypothetical protein
VSLVDDQCDPIKNLAVDDCLLRKPPQGVTARLDFEAMQRTVYDSDVDSD